MKLWGFTNDSPEDYRTDKVHLQQGSFWSSTPKGSTTEIILKFDQFTGGVIGCA